MNLVGKVAIVTGGSRMTGRAIVLALAEAGVRVVTCARQADQLAGAVRELSTHDKMVIGVRGDIGNPADVKQIVSSAVTTFGGVDILVNNAARGGGGRTEECTLEDWEAVFATNVRGPFLLAQQVIPLMRQRGGGHIISIGSGAGKQGYAGMPAYSASKFALIGFSESLAQEVTNDRIKVSVINPGTIRDTTQMGRTQPGVKYLLPSDVAAAVVGLLQQGDHAWTQEMNLWPFRGDS